MTPNRMALMPREREKQSAWVVDSPNILKKFPWKDRQVKFDREDDEEDANQASPDAHFDELSRIGDNRRAEQDGPFVTNKFFTERDVFQHRLIGKAAQMLKEATANKQRLVSIDDTSMTAPEIIEPGN